MFIGDFMSDLDEFANMYVVPEELMIMCSTQMTILEPTNPENNFDLMLKKGDIFKEAGLQPLYLCTPDMSTIYVTTKEKLNNQFN